MNHGTKTNPLMKTFHKLAMDMEGRKAKKLATLNLKLTSLRIPKAIGQRRRKLEGNQVGKKTTLQIWWISFVIPIITKKELSSRIQKTQETMRYIASCSKICRSGSRTTWSWGSVCGLVCSLNILMSSCQFVFVECMSSVRLTDARTQTVVQEIK